MSAAIIVGLACGAVIGGLGGRLAMRILLLTSDAAVKGMESDDGFEIGRFTLSSTAGLVAITALIGVLAALLYLAARPVVGPLGRAEGPVMAVFYGIVGGAMMVHRGGVDFTVLEPAALAIGLFVVICATFGAVAGWLIRRATRPGGWASTRSWKVVGPPLVVLVFPPFLVAALFAAVVDWAIGSRAPAHPGLDAVRLAGGAALFLLFVVGAVDLTRDVVALT